MVGLSTIGNISFAIAFVAGNKRVPNPAAGITAFLTFFIVIPPFVLDVILMKLQIFFLFPSIAKFLL